MSYPDDELFFHKLSRFQRLYAKSLSSRLTPYGVQPGYLAILERLWQNDNVTQKALKATMDIEQATLSNTLKRMERDGLIERTPIKNDRRKHLITLTDNGTSIQSTVQGAINDLRTTVNQGLTINDRRYFKRIMRQMSEHLENDQIEPIVVLFDEITEE